VNNYNLNSISKMLLAIAASLALASCKPETTETTMDWQTPAFKLEDSAGQVLDYPADLTAPTIVLFWATWCPYCKALMPHLQSIVDEYDGKVDVLALNFREDEDPAEYISNRGFDFRLFPESDPVAQLWGIKTTPGLFLVDQTGRAVFSNFSLPEKARPANPALAAEDMKHYQKAARKAPYWAAHLRLAIDEALR
jgi:thiol-disulfide isomerase/thioredoxin